jgi:hypothetical protein
MSPRKRKMSLGEALEALKDLPRVLKALEVLNGEQEKVRALMGQTSTLSGAYRDWTPAPQQPGVVEAVRSLDPDLAARLKGGPAVLNTPERREYEAARKAGKVVVDPFAGISDAQRERMEEQKALVERLRASRGVPAKVAAVETAMEIGAASSPAEVVPVVGTEEVEQSATGSVGAEVESGGFTDG